MILLGLTITGAMFVAPVMAENLSSDSYLITFGNFNVTSGEKSSDSYVLTDTVGQTGAGPYGAYGVSSYFLGGGFQYIYQIQRFAFSISKLDIELGTLTTFANNTDSHTLNITTRGAGGYAVYAYEGHPLQHHDGVTTIADTTCDAGTCSQTAAGIWTNVGINGFGYNASGDDVPADFITTNHFRQFSDNSIGEEMQAVMSASDIARTAQATITYKAGVAGNKAAGEYQTHVVYVAVPGY